MEKAEYIKQLKQIIKKYHPDLCSDSHLESMYVEITKKLTVILNGLKANDCFDNNKQIKYSSNKNEILIVRDQGYVYYKLGIQYYKNIHPDRFYIVNSDNTFETKSYSELVSVLNNIFLAFNLSEYYFRKVIMEYPKSLYWEDARDKIKLSKKLYKSYENIAVEEHKIISAERFIHTMGLKIL